MRLVKDFALFLATSQVAHGNLLSIDSNRFHSIVFWKKWVKPVLSASNVQFSNTRKKMATLLKKFWIQGTIASARHIATSKTSFITICWILITFLVSACFGLHVYILVAEYLRFEKFVNIKVSNCINNMYLQYWVWSTYNVPQKAIIKAMNRRNFLKISRSYVGRANDNFHKEPK